MRSPRLLNIAVILGGFLLAWTLFLLWVLQAEAQTPAACTHYAAPTGSGAACTAAQPCKIASWWSMAGPGKTLCLKDGVYKGEDSLIMPPAGTKGTQAQPITIRATNDGQVLLDAQHASFAAVAIGWHQGGPTENQWFVVEGVNAMNGTEYLYTVSGAHNLLRRVIGWNGTNGFSGQAISVTGYGSRAEDCAAWGMNWRKIFQSSQSDNVQQAGYRRCWGEWNDSPQTTEGPLNTLQIGYNTTNQLFENMVLTWDTRGQIGETEGVIGAMTTNTAGRANDIQGTRLLGSLLYLRPGATYSTPTLFLSNNTTGLTVTDTAMVVPPSFPSVFPAIFLACNDVPCTRNVCQNCLSVHAGRPLVNQQGAGWTTPGLHEGRGLEAATGGRSAFELLPGLCRRYVDGQLTDTPLWPWPMNERITAARVQSGFHPVDVTAEVEQALGPIPAACKAGGTPPGPGGDTDAPHVTLTAPSHDALVSGTAVAVSADASDNVGVVGIRFFLDGVQVGTEQAGASVHVLADSTSVANGLHKLKAVARDQAGNEGTSGTIDVTVFNSPTVPPQGGHPPLACTGALGAGARIDLVCTPEAGR